MLKAGVHPDVNNSNIAPKRKLERSFHHVHALTIQNERLESTLVSIVDIPSIHIPVL